MNSEEHGGFRGVWLRGSGIEAFVAHDPFIRVLAVRRPGRESPLWLGERDPLAGLRTWFMEPGQTTASRLPGEQPGVHLECDSHSAFVSGAPNQATALRLDLRVAISDWQPIIFVEHILNNLAPHTRRLALWPIIAVARSGEAVVPFDSLDRNSIVYWPNLDQRHPALTRSDDSVRIVLTPSVTHPSPFKLGVITSNGWITRHYDDQVLWSHVARLPSCEYPEGGGDVTVYCGPVAELEHVGPLLDVHGGAHTSMVQRIGLFSEGNFRSGHADASGSTPPFAPDH